MDGGAAGGVDGEDLAVVGVGGGAARIATASAAEAPRAMKSRRRGPRVGWRLCRLATAPTPARA